MKRYITATGIVTLLMFCFTMGDALAGKKLLDDFSDPYIDTSKWQQGELVREIAGGKLISKIGGNAEPGDDFILNQLGFFDPNSINSIEAAINLKASRLDNSDTHFAGAQIEGFFYDGASGSVWAGIQIGETENGLEASYGISDGGGGALPITIQYNTDYLVKIEYNELTNEFRFSVNDVSETGAGPPRVGPSTEDWKALTTGIWGVGSLVSGFTSATFDNVRINNEPTPYDDFSTALLDITKWNEGTLEHVREISNGKLRMNARNTNPGRVSVNSRLVNFDRHYIEAKMLIKSDTQIPAGQQGFARFGGWYYNDSRGPGSGQGYNGNDSDVWVAIMLYNSGGGQQEACAQLWRSDDANATSGTELLWECFPTTISYDTEYKLSIQFTGSTFIFRCNALAPITYKVQTTMYEPYEEWAGFTSRVYADPGYIKATFDDVYIYTPGIGPGINVLLLGDP